MCYWTSLGMFLRTDIFCQKVFLKYVLSRKNFCFPSFGLKFEAFEFLVTSAGLGPWTCTNSKLQWQAHWAASRLGKKCDIKIPHTGIALCCSTASLENISFHINVKRDDGGEEGVLLGIFFHGAGKWNMGMKVKAETPKLGEELRASPGMTRLMWGILLSGKTLAHILERLELALGLGNITAPHTLRGYLNRHIGSLPGILQHISRKTRISFLRSHCNFL